mgnify:CR=1 FL=1
MQTAPSTPTPRRVLLAVTGLSPQVVTETLYALATRKDEPFIPDEVHLVTTAEGAERARLALLSEQPGWFHRLREDYDLPSIRLDADTIHVIRDSAGNTLDDIRAPEDNLVCANFITEKVRELTADPSTILHVSIAGGRKTMGFLLGYALSLFGRPSDRLSHVIVSEPFESSWEFFYPTPYSRVIETRDRKLADTRDAKISLAEIPFVSLRHGLPQALLLGHSSYRATVEAARIGVSPATLEIAPGTREVHIHGKRFTLSPTELALLCVFARHTQQRQPPLAAPAKGVREPEWAERLLKELRSILGPLGDITKTERALHGGMDGEYFSSLLSKLRRSLIRQLGPGAHARLIDDGGRRPHRYQLEIAPERIFVLGEPSASRR